MNVLHARNLVIPPGQTSVDPYVKCYLMPDPNKDSKRRTATKHGTQFPTFNEIFEYKGIFQQDLLSKTLQV